MHTVPDRVHAVFVVATYLNLTEYNLQGRGGFAKQLLQGMSLTLFALVISSLLCLTLVEVSLVHWVLEYLAVYHGTGVFIVSVA